MKRVAIVKRGLLLGIITACFVLSAPLAVVAQEVPVQEQSPRPSESNRENVNRDTTAESRREEVKNNVEQRREEAKTRLQDAKLKACEKREKAITTIMSRIADRGQKHLDLFTKIAQRTKDFYVEKGKTLANYDELVAQVDAKRAAAESAVQAVTSRSGEFQCESDDPKGAIQSFKDVRQVRIDAMKEYRTAVKNLIVGVKSVQATTASERADQ